jgi:hypothetical protein
MWRELRAYSSVVRPKVVPDSSAMDALERKLAGLSYRPSNGFHKDRLQPRVGDDISWRVRWVHS